MQLSRHLLVKLYNRDHSDSLDEMRQHLFTQGVKDLRLLPPTEDAFKLHVLRAMHQILWWINAHLSEPLIPPATDFGRELRDGQLRPIPVCLPIKPDAVTKTYCKCNASRCLTNACSCVKAGISCNIGCHCSVNNKRCGRLVDNIDSDCSDSDGDNVET